MAKKSAKSSSSKPSDIVENPNWVSSNLLESKDSSVSVIKETKVEEIKLLFNGNVDIVIPPSPVGADWHRDDWVCFYYYPFDIGMTFPFSKLVEDVLKTLDASPGQLMPSARRILACLDAIKEKHHLEIGVNVVNHSYTTKKFSGCRYGLVSKKKDDPLILKLETVNDRGWKNEFFFAKKSDLGKEMAFLREEWNGEDRPLGPQEIDVVAASVVDKIVALPGKERLWPNCLGRPVRNASPVNVEEYFEKTNKTTAKYDAASFEKSVVVKSAAGRTRNKRAVNISNARTCGGNTGSPSRSVHSVSSESEDNPKAEAGLELSVGRQIAKEFKPPSLQVVSFSSKDLFAKRSRDDKSTETESSKATILASPEAKRVRVLEDPSGNAGKKSLARVVPSTKHGVDARPRLPASSLKNFLLPQTVKAHSSKGADVLIEDTVGSIYDSFQSALMLQEAYVVEVRQRMELEIDYAHAVEQLKELRSEHNGCDEKFHTLQKKADKTSKSLKEIQAEFDEFAGKVKDMNDKYVADTKGIIIEHIMRSRAEMMLEYKKGEWEFWAVDETIKEYNDKYPEKALALDAPNESGHQPLLGICWS